MCGTNSKLISCVNQIAMPRRKSKTCALLSADLSPILYSPKILTGTQLMQATSACMFMVIDITVSSKPNRGVKAPRFVLRPCLVASHLRARWLKFAAILIAFLGNLRRIRKTATVFVSPKETTSRRSEASGRPWHQSVRDREAQYA